MKRKVVKFKRNEEKRNLNPMNNRKKVGIILFATSIGLFFLFAARLSYIVIGGHVADVSLKDKTEALYQDTKVEKAERGKILDRNGEAIAANSQTYKLKAILSETYVSGDKKLYAQEKDFNAIAAILEEQLGISRDETVTKLQNGQNEGRYQVEFGSAGRNISLEKKNSIEAAVKEAGAAGIYFDDFSSRIYPNGIFASHLIGYAEADSENPDKGLVGQAGIEAAYNNILSGTDGVTKYQKNIYGNPLPGTTEETTEAVRGSDIYTTIDRSMQNLFEDKMDEMFDRLSPENATAVLMKAKTGEIVAMTQRPSYNPETLDGVEAENFVWRNLFTEDLFEPGSTIKVATVASAMDDGVYNAWDYYEPKGGIVIEDTTVNDWDNGTTRDSLSFRQALTHSSNVGMVLLEQKMEANSSNSWVNHLERFGFGQSTYSGLSVENSNAVSLSNVVDKAMSAYGQAISVTQFQMLKMFTAIANNGKMLQPQFISKIENPETNETKVVEPEVVGQPISAEAANQVLSNMREVIEDEKLGTATNAGYSLDGYSIAVKTGTAQIGREDGTGYMSDGNYIYSAVLMYPAESPEYILYLTAKLPKVWSDNIQFSDFANPVMKRSMELLDTESSDNGESTAKVTVPDYSDKGYNDAAVSARREVLNPIVLGSGDTVTQQSLAAGSEVDPNTRILLLTGGSVKMPDTTGWTRGELEALGTILNVEVSISGEGTCNSQSIAANTLLGEDAISFTLGY